MKSIFFRKSLPFSLFLLGVFFMPFNSFNGYEILGEYKRDSCFFFFFFSGILVLLTKKFSLPLNSSFFKILILILLYFLLSGLFNIYDLTHYYFKQTSGVSRFIRQYVSLILSSIFLLFVFYNVLKQYEVNKVFYIIRTVIFYSLVIVTLYAFIELLIVKFNKKELISVLNIFNYFPFTKVHLDSSTNRMSSVTFESPALATYLISIAGWMFSYVLTNKGIKRFIPMFLTIILSFLSGSRAGIFVIIIQIMAFGMYLMKDKKYKKLFLNIFLISSSLGIIILLFFSTPIINYVSSKVMSFKTDDDVHAMSNKTRFGIQAAMLDVFLNNPIKGTGYGLQAYESSKLYPEWAVKNNWEFRLKYLNNEHKSFPPGFNLYIRLLSETGIIGFILFSLLLLLILSWCYKKTFKKHGNQTVIPLVIMISMIGFIFNWFKMDTFRIYFFWLCLALIILIQRQGNINEQKKNNSFNTPLQ